MENGVLGLLFLLCLPAMHAGICVKESVSSGAFRDTSVSSQATPTEYHRFSVATEYTTFK